MSEQQKRKIAEIRKQLEHVTAYEKARKEIETLKKVVIFRKCNGQKKDALYAEANDVAAQLTQLSETILVSEALLRLEELTNREVDSPFLSQFQWKKEALSRTHIPIPTEKVGRLCGKGNSNLHKLEEDLKVFIHNARDGFTVLGEKVNVDKCEVMVKDMLNEVEETVKVGKDEVRALLAHNAKYRRMIEDQYHVISRLVDNETIRLLGGQNSVKQAERGIHDLFKSESDRNV